MERESEHKPFIAASENLPELTLAPILAGAVLGIIFGASSLYLALKVGMTVSASIPVAVLSITLFRWFSKVFGLRPANILENNIVQTTGSAGESIAFGVAVTMPALMILGYEMEVSRTLMVAILGGLLGILMMIPLRYALIVKGHKELTYPEGTACAEVLLAGERGGIGAKTVFFGFFYGLFYKVLNLGFKLWDDTPTKVMSWFKGSAIAAEVSPELLGVGYIIGTRTASITFGGGVLASFVLIPMIKLFGDGLAAPLFPGTKPISQMAIHEIWRSYILYIGAGAVAAAGIISLVRSLPIIIHGAKAGFSGITSVAGNSARRILRTERDLPFTFVLGGIVALILIIWSIPTLKMNLLGALLIVIFGFLFVTVSSRLTGEIGSSSNPISGMTVATLLLTSLIFLSLGWVSPEYRVTALTVAAIVCIAASNGGTTSQDLKTGYLVGGTPSAQQIAILIGAFTSALVIGFTLNVLNDASTIYSKKNFPPNLIVPVNALTEMQGVKDQALNDSNQYHVLRVTEASAQGTLAQLHPGKYLIDDTGHIQYLVDPGINGSLKTKDDGTTVQKYEAPKARLMSLIIDGILTQRLPWGLVLLGAFIAVVLELCSISALAFSVGVYLPISVTAPIFMGGLIRWMSGLGQKNKANQGSEESDSGPGILFSSGLIAGGSIGGIALAILMVNSTLGSSLDFSKLIPAISESHLTSVVMFTVMCAFLFGIARNKK